MKKFLLLLNIFLCFALVFCIIQINDLENQVNHLRNSLNNVDHNLSYNISNIYQNVRDMLDEQENQLTVSEWEFGSIDVESRTAEILCTVVPKEYHPNVTQVKLTNGNEEYELSFADNKYSSVITIPLFETTKIDQVILTDNGTVRTQKLNWDIQPRYEALLYAFASSTGEGRGTYDDDGYTWKPNNMIRINVEKKGTFEINQIDVVEMMDGKEMSRIHVDISNAAQKEYADEFSKKGYSVPEYFYDSSRDESREYDGYAVFYYPFNKEVQVPHGSEYIQFADITDGNNLTYRCFIECISIDDNGEHNEAREEELRLYSFGEAVTILDDHGNVLFEIDESLFK